MSDIKYFSDIPNTPQALGPYSKAVEFDKLIFLSGNTGVNPETGKLAGESIEDQTAQVLKNISAALQHLGTGFSRVVKTTIFLTDLANFKTVNDIYEKALGGSKPARSTVGVSQLPGGAIVEIEMIVAKPA